jgi:TRAP transporter TAXI family solute receptor
MTNMASLNLPLWLRLVLLVGVVGLATGASLLAYRYYTRPVTLSVAVGSIDGEAAKAMSAIASRLASDNAPVRIKVIDSGTALEAAKAFSEGKADLAVVRGDVGDLSQAQAVVVVSHVVVLVIVPPGSTIDSIDKLKGRRVGVISGEANTKIVDILSREYGLDRAKVFKDIALPDARRAIQSKEVSALLVVIPLAGKYLSLVRDFFQQGSKALPVLLPIDSAGAIAQAERAYESFDVPKGTLRGSPPVPDDDLTTLRASLYLVAHKKLSTDLITSLTLTIMKVRRELLSEQPIFAQITAPSTDQDAYLPLHPGAAAVYNSTQQSFMDEYGNWIYLTPMALGGIATVFAAAWKFLGLGQPTTGEGPLDSLYALGRRIRKAGTEAELSSIEEEIDDILNAQRTKSARGDENAVDDATLNVAAHRLEGLIHDRRNMLARKPAIISAA